MKYSPPVVAIALILFATGCVCSRGSGGSPIGAGAELFPATLESQPITMNLGGIVLAEAHLDFEAKNGERTLLIRNEEVVIEKEVYQVDDQGIALARIGPGEGDQFDPPLTLIRFPAKEGDKVEWKGSQRFGATRGVNATAVSTTQTEVVSLATGSAQAIRVDVEITLDDGSPQKSKRRLEFWFVNGSGPVKRDFGASQVREPRLPGKPADPPSEG